METGNDIGAKPPKCRCGNDAFMLVGHFFMCGDCLMKYQAFKENDEARMLDAFYQGAA